MSDAGRRWKRIWLISITALVLVMIAVGGVTRLTRSGLSIVEWKPVAGIIPPLTEQDWQQQFDLYKQSPEYNLVNSHFELSDYKNIFIWEYLHRVLGRLIFLFVVIPGLLLYQKKWVEGNIVLWLSLLVAGQGLIGWLMVKSGLNHQPHVSPYMLALHFFSALFVLLFAHYHQTKLRQPLNVILSQKQKILMQIFGGVLLLQIFYGCLTSGLKAGFAFNTYPLMGGNFFPAAGLELEPTWLNFFENPSTVQWTHRWTGLLVLIIAFVLIKNLAASDSWKKIKGPFIHLLGVVFSQVVLGICSLVFGVPIWLAVLHQMCAAMLAMSYFSIIFRLSPQ